MEIKENEILKGIILFLLIVTLLYFIFPLAQIKDFASYLSGLSTVGILVLTSFYVFYTNRQIRELQKQRQLQIQPLPNIEIIEPIIRHPRLVGYLFEHTNFSFRVALSFRIKGKNIGNGAAILVDIFHSFVGAKIDEIEKETINAHRINACEEDKEFDFKSSIKDDNLQMLKVLHSTSGEGCAANTAFDVLLRSNILYRNVLGTAFLLNIDHIIAIDDENQQKITEWLSIMSSYESRYATDISMIKSIWQRDKIEAWNLFSDLAETVKKEFNDQDISVQLLPYAGSFQVKTLGERESKQLSEKIGHGIPLGITKEEENNGSPDKKDEMTFNKANSADTKNRAAD